jgi:hypothetical protein
MPQALYILFGAVFTAASSFGLGRVLLKQLRLKLYRQEEYAFAFLLGSACLSLLVFALATVQLLHKGVFLLAGIAAISAGWRYRFAGTPLPPLPRLWLCLLTPLATAFALLSFAHAMAPEMSPDGSSYHLGLVSKYYRERGFSRLTTNMYANLSQGAEMLFLFAWAWGRHSAAALTHLSFLFALAWMVLNFGRRFGEPVAGMAASTIVFVTPVIGIDAASAYIDLAAAAVIFGTFYVMQVWDRERSNALVWAAGVLSGFAYAVKYTAFLALPYALVFLAWRRQWKSVPRLILIASLWIAPWMIKNAVIVDNPVSPFFNRVFPNEHVHVSFEEEYRRHMRNYDGLRSLWDIPVELTVRGHVLCGLLGPLFLFAPLAVLALSHRLGRGLLVAGLVFGAVYATNIGTRFLIPAVAFVALSMALVLRKWPLLLASVTLAHAISAWPDVMKLYCAPYAWRLDRIWWKQALRIESEDGFLRRMWPFYSVARMVETLTPAQARVMSWNQMSEAYTTREIVVPYQSARGAVWGGLVWTPLIREYQPTTVYVFELPGRPVRRLRLRQTTSHVNHFAVGELRVYRKGHEIPRQSDWRLRAWPNPWYSPKAFDNEELTRWSSWERARNGMFLEVELPVAVEADRVEATTSQSEIQYGLQLDWEAAGGAIQTVQQATERGLPPPLGMRREVTRLLKQDGITHLLVADYDFGSGDLRTRQEEWGIALIGEAGDIRLYAIR